MHFINTPQSILKILLPLSESEEDRESARLARRRKLQPYVTSVVDDYESFVTKSQGLHTNQDTVEAAEATAVKEPDTEEADTEVKKHEAKAMSKEEDRLFLCFCILEELNKLRQSIRVYWLAWSRHQMSLEEASLLTQTTLDIARKCIDDFEIFEEGTTLYKAVFLEFFWEGM